MGGSEESGARVFLRVPEVPVHVGVLWPSEAAARGCPRGEIALAYDPASGFIANAAFDAGRVDYSLRYDNALHFSPFFRRYEDALARRLVERHDLRGKHVVEVGAGGGHFLARLCEIGDNRGTGFDPSHDADHADPALGGRVRVVRGEFSAETAGERVDLLCCRHVLEHIAEPRAFLRGLRRALEGQPDAVVYFEVPDSYLILRQLSIWDVIYEHCGYFVPESLRAMFEGCGFEVLDVHSAYDGQFVGIEARIGRERESEGRSPELDAAVEHFAARFAEKRDAWQSRLGELRREGRRVVVWGGGAKAVSFLNLLEIGDQIEVVIDVNPGKQGSHLAGSGQPIHPPEFLRNYVPDVAIVMNPLYEPEIQSTLAEISPSTKTICA